MSFSCSSTDINTIISKKSIIDVLLMCSLKKYDIKDNNILLCK